MNTRTLSYVTLIAAAMAAPATAAPSEPATPAAQPEKKAAPAEAKGAAPAQQESEDADYTGKIVERMNGGGYTYFLLDNAGKQTWVAVPQTEQGKVGETATFRNGIEMANFKSRALNRTFERIFFSAGAVGAAGGEGFLKQKAHAMGSQQQGAQQPAAKPEGKPEAKSAPGGKVEKASGPSAHTISEVHQKKSSLKNQEVTVRGRVSKVSKQIMGKNWLHLEDGSGDAGAGSDDLVVTTKETASEGDVVTVKGKLSVDRDFGAGYKFSVIIEDAALAK